MLKIIIDMIFASFIVAYFQAFVGIITIFAFIWAAMILSRDSKSREKTNSLKEIEIGKNIELKEKEIYLKDKELDYQFKLKYMEFIIPEQQKLLNKLEQYAKLALRNGSSEYFMLRTITEPTITFDPHQPFISDKNPPKDNSMYHTLLDDYIFAKNEVAIYFPKQLELYEDFLKAANIQSCEHDPVKQVDLFEITISKYNLFVDSCIKYMQDNTII